MPIDSTQSEASERLGIGRGGDARRGALYESWEHRCTRRLCERGASDADIVALVSRGKEGCGAHAPFSSVHYLLLQDPSDP